jgi:O-antigen/teichoic acid export membrane protein
MWSKIKDIFKSQKGGTTLGFSTFLGSIISGIFGVFVAPILGAEDYGTVSYFFAIAGFAYAIASFGAHHVLLVYLSKGIKIFSTFSFITLIFSFIISIIVFLIFNEISISILIIGLIVFELLISELLAKQLYSKHLKYYLTQRLSFVVLSLFFYHLWGPPGFILGHAVSLFPGIYRIYLGFKESKIEISLIKERFDFVIHHYFLHLARTSYSYLDRIIIFPLFGFITLGNYELSIQIIVLANVFSVFVYQYLQPKDAKNESTKKLKYVAILVSFILSLAVIFLSPIIMPLLFPQFEESLNLVPIMGLSIVPHTLIMLYMSKFLGSEKTKPILTSSLLHLGILIIAIFILTGIYSSLGLAIAFVIAEIVEALFLISMHKKIFNNYL